MYSSADHASAGTSDHSNSHLFSMHRYQLTGASYIAAQIFSARALLRLVRHSLRENRAWWLHAMRMAPSSESPFLSKRLEAFHAGVALTSVRPSNHVSTRQRRMRFLAVPAA